MEYVVVYGLCMHEAPIHSVAIDRDILCTISIVSTMCIAGIRVMY